MGFFKIIGRAIVLLAYAAGGAILAMMGVTVMDVILRLFGSGITGAYDIVRSLGVIAVAFALPYLTAVKGHIAIEFFYHKFGSLGRTILDSLIRIISMAIFGILAFQTFKHGLFLYKTGEVFPTLGMPVFWVALAISLSSILMMIVFIYHLIHPGKEFIKP